MYAKFFITISLLKSFQKKTFKRFSKLRINSFINLKFVLILLFLKKNFTHGEKAIIDQKVDGLFRKIFK